MPASSAHAGAYGSLPQRLLAVITSNRASIIAAILLLVIFGSGGLFILGGGRLFGGGAHPTGQVAFVDSSNGPAGHLDALTMSVQGLSAPTDGTHYSAWILNHQTERVIRLGNLTGSNTTYALTLYWRWFVGAAGHKSGRRRRHAGDHARTGEQQ